MRLPARFCASKRSLMSIHARFRNVAQLGSRFVTSSPTRQKFFHESDQPQPLEALSNLFRDKTLHELQALAAPVLSTGSLWDQAQPLKNPWRFRIENISLGPIFTHALNGSLVPLRDADGRHVAFITTNGVGFPFLSPPKTFIEFADWWLPRVREVIDRKLLTLVGGWAKLAGGDGVLAGAAAKLEPLLQLGHELAAEPPDTELAEKFVALEVADARAQLQRAECVQRFYPKWWRCFRGEFRRARKELKVFCGKPKLSADDIDALAKFLRAWLDRDALRNGLADLDVTFPAESDEELTTAVHSQSFAIHTAQLLVDAAAEPAFATLREHFENRDSAGVEAWIKDIHATVERARVADDVIDNLKPLGKWLPGEFLASLCKKVCAGESIGQEISEIEAGARQLDALQMLDEVACSAKASNVRSCRPSNRIKRHSRRVATRARPGGRRRSFRLIWAGRIVANARHRFSAK